MNVEEYRNIIEPVVNRNNCILWGIEILRGRKRTTLRIFYEDNGEKEFTLLENDPSRKWLVDQVYVLTNKDEIMENTYQRIVAEEASFCFRK